MGDAVRFYGDLVSLSLLCMRVMPGDADSLGMRSIWFWTVSTAFHTVPESIMGLS